MTFTEFAAPPHRSQPRVQTSNRLALAALALALAGCGGKSITGGGNPLSTNQVPLTVDAGPSGSVNTLFVSVTVCAPASTNCATIDHVQLDTMSTGLRLIASVLPASLSLPAVNSSGGAPLYECQPFNDGYTWGAVRSADVKLGDEMAGAIPVQVIGEIGEPTVAGDCAQGLPPENSVQLLGANGVLGLGYFREDCGAACVTSAVARAYYDCSGASCVSVAATLAQQLQNPVPHFATDNNGVRINLPSPGSSGSLTARGILTFGIGTQSNNALGMATPYAVDPTFGTLRTVYGSQLMPNSLIDSGAPGLFFSDASLPPCTVTLTAYYCPATEQMLSATIQGASGSAANMVSFSVANAQQLTSANGNYTAFQNVAGPNPDSSSFVWGLPFFYGRLVFVAIEGQSTAAGPGPYIAF